MRKFLVSQQHRLRWVLLFLSAVILGIALSQGINRSQLFTNGTVYPESFSAMPDQAQTTSPSIADTTSIELKIQSKYDRTLAHYATVSRSDGSFRQMFVNEETITSIQPGEPLPNGTLIVMETWYSPENLGTVFVKQKQNGEWQYGSFSPDRPDYQMRFSGSCHSCHAPFPETDFTLTKPLLEAALQTRQVQTAYCDRAGRTPCEPTAYIPHTSN
jgi:Cytochrome P460